MKAAIYIRVSSDMQLEGYSMEAQTAACQRLADQRGWEIGAIYNEKGESAKTTQRPQFRAMMRDAHASKFDVVVVHKMDRFSRSVIDVLTAFKELVSANVGFVSVTEGRFDLSDPAGRLQMTILAAVNEWYLGNLSAETAKGKRARAEAGLWNGAVPFGYQADYKKDGGDGVPYPDEHEAEGVRLAFEQYATGQCSDNDVAKLLNEAGYRPKGRGDRALALFSKDTVTMILQNRFYVGEVSYKGEWFPGQHEAIVSDELFERCQAARRSRRHRPGTTAPKSSRAYPLTGLARCARCGGRMRGNSVRAHRYYRDPARDRGQECDQRMVKADEAEDALGDFLQQLVLPEDWQARVLAYIEASESEAANVARQQARLEGRLKRLKDLYLLGDLDKHEYLQERDRLRAQLAVLTPSEMPDLELAAALLQNFGEIWQAATSSERRQIAHSLLNAVYLDVDQGPVVAIEPKAEFAPLFELAKVSLVGLTPVAPASDIIILSPGAELDMWWG